MRNVSGRDNPGVRSQCRCIEDSVLGVRSVSARDFVQFGRMGAAHRIRAASYRSDAGECTARAPGSLQVHVSSDRIRRTACVLARVENSSRMIEGVDSRREILGLETDLQLLVHYVVAARPTRRRFLPNQRRTRKSSVRLTGNTNRSYVASALRLMLPSSLPRSLKSSVARKPMEST